MTKRLLAKTGTYTKDGQEKNEYVKLGILKQGDQGGEYMILDPSVNLAGVLMKQNALAAKQGKPARDSVMVSVFDNQQQGFQQQQAPQQGFQQQQQPQSLPTMAQQEQIQGDQDIPF